MNEVTDKVLLASVAAIKDKLDRIRLTLAHAYTVNGSIDPDHQWAIRIIDARKRDLDRALLIRTLKEGHPDRILAELEFSLARRDDGTLFRWVYNNHSYGRLGCKGCEFDYIQDPKTGARLKDIKIRLCPHCQKGLQHSFLVDRDDELTEAFEGFLASVPLDTKPSAPHSQTWLDPQLFYMCDVCGFWSLEVA